MLMMPYCASTTFWTCARYSGLYGGRIDGFRCGALVPLAPAYEKKMSPSAVLVVSCCLPAPFASGTSAVPPRFPAPGSSVPCAPPGQKPVKLGWPSAMRGVDAAEGFLSSVRIGALVEWVTW